MALCDLIIREAHGLDTLNLKANIDGKRRSLEFAEESSLYSAKQGKRVPFATKIDEIEDDYKDWIFGLAGNKGETVESLKRKSLQEVLDFDKRLREENGRH